SRERAQKMGVEPLVEIVAHGMSADRYAWLHTVPALALSNALKKAGLDADDLELVEINEAFAAVALNVTRMLALDEERVNVNGGAVALGHPIGASGARLLLTVAKELKRRGLRTGAAALCGGGGQGDALIVRRPLQGANASESPTVPGPHRSRPTFCSHAPWACATRSCGGREAVNTIVALDALGQREPTSIAFGNDFYSSPKLSPDGARLAWQTWNHPSMPWDGSEIWVGELDRDGNVTSSRKVAGGAHES